MIFAILRPRLLNYSSSALPVLFLMEFEGERDVSVGHLGN